MPLNLTLAVGATRALTITPKSGTGAALSTVGRTVTGTSADASKGVVTADGIVTARGVTAAGTPVVLTITVDGKSETVNLTVTPAPVSVELSPADTTLGFENTLQLTATVKDGTGATIAGAGVTWSTSNAAIASVSASGLVTGVEYGTATITATSGSVSATRSITVQVPPAETFEQDFALDPLGVPRKYPSGLTDIRYQTVPGPSDRGNGFFYGKRYNKREWAVQGTVAHQLAARGVAPGGTPTTRHPTITTTTVDGMYGGSTAPGFLVTVPAWDPVLDASTSFINVNYERVMINGVSDPYNTRVGYDVGIRAYDAANVGRIAGDLYLWNDTAGAEIAGTRVKNIVLGAAYQSIRIEVPFTPVTTQVVLRLRFAPYDGRERATSIVLWNFAPLVNTELLPLDSKDRSYLTNKLGDAGATLAVSANAMMHEKYGLYVGGFADFRFLHSDNFGDVAWTNSGVTIVASPPVRKAPDFEYTGQNWKALQFSGGGFIGQTREFPNSASGLLTCDGDNLRCAVALLPYDDQTNFPAPDDLIFRCRGMNNASTLNLTSPAFNLATATPDEFGLFRASFAIPAGEPATLFEIRLESFDAVAPFGGHAMAYRFQAWRDPFVVERNQGNIEQLVPSPTKTTNVYLQQARLGVSPLDLLLTRTAGIAVYRFRLPWSLSELETQPDSVARVQRCIVETGPAASSAYTFRIEFQGPIAGAQSRGMYFSMAHTGAQSAHIEVPVSDNAWFVKDTDYVVACRWQGGNYLDYAFLGGVHGTTYTDVVWRTAGVIPYNAALATWEFPATTDWVGQDRDNDSCLAGWIRARRYEKRLYTQAQTARIMAEMLTRA